MIEKNKNEGLSLLERHAQTIMVFIITALVAWVGSNISSQQVQIALLQQTVTELKEEVKEFTRKPRFSRDDFLIEMRLYDNRIKLIESNQVKILDRIYDKDRRISDLENWKKNSNTK